VQPTRPLALIAGGSAGIGLALARRLAYRGYDLILLARGVDRLRGAVAGLPAGTVGHAVDVGEPAAIVALADRLRADGLERLDLLVCNAGIPGRASALDVDAATARRVMAVNYHGMVELTRALWPELVAAHGAVVNVCSVAGTAAVAAAAPYAASKHAAVGWSRSLAGVAGRSGVRVLTVNPGPVATDGFPQHRLLEQRRTRWLVITPDACAAAIVRGLDRRRTEITVPGWWRVLGVLQAVAPGAFARLGGRVWRG
jgi:short-subunit dehydrogenase